MPSLGTKVQSADRSQLASTDLSEEKTATPHNLDSERARAMPIDVAVNVVSYV